MAEPQGQSSTLIESAERSLEHLLSPYQQDASGQRVRLSESDVRRVSVALQYMGKDTWAKVPRLYVILRLVKQVSVIDTFLAQGVSDIWFPFSHKTLPDALQSASARFNFIDLQDVVLTKAFDLEREDGRHRHFSRAEDVPLQKLGELGKGGFGYVDRVLSTITYREYARKTIPKGRTFKKNYQVLLDFERELNNLKKLSHMHVVEFIGSYTDPKFVAILMSPVADYNLKDFLGQHSLTIGERSFLRTFFGCLTSALCYLHEQRVRHKDIKPQNVLVKGSQVFLTDFGISLDWTELGESTTSGVTIKTPRYCAPEVASYLPRNSLADMWSLGCVFLEMWAVLMGETVETVLQYLECHGTKSTCYYLNHITALEWCEQKVGNGTDLEMNIPLLWIRQLLQPDQNSRWTAQTLANHIHDANESPDLRYAFSGICCADGDESTDAGSSSKRSSLLLEETGASSVEVYDPKSSLNRLKGEDFASSSSPTLHPPTSTANELSRPRSTSLLRKSFDSTNSSVFKLDSDKPSSVELNQIVPSAAEETTQRASETNTQKRIARKPVARPTSPEIQTEDLSDRLNAVRLISSEIRAKQLVDDKNYVVRLPAPPDSHGKIMTTRSEVEPESLTFPTPDDQKQPARVGVLEAPLPSTRVKSSLLAVPESFADGSTDNKGARNNMEGGAQIVSSLPSESHEDNAVIDIPHISDASLRTDDVDQAPVGVIRETERKSQAHSKAFQSTDTEAVFYDALDGSDQRGSSESTTTIHEQPDELLNERSRSTANIYAEQPTAKLMALTQSSQNDQTPSDSNLLRHRFSWEKQEDSGIKPSVVSEYRMVKEEPKIESVQAKGHSRNSGPTLSNSTLKSVGASTAPDTTRSKKDRRTFFGQIKSVFGNLPRSIGSDQHASDRPSQHRERRIVAKHALPEATDDSLKTLQSPSKVNSKEPLGDTIQTKAKSKEISRTNQPSIDTLSESKRVQTLENNTRVEHGQSSTLSNTKIDRMCGHCQKPIPDQFVRALNDTYHLNCFTCKDCGQIVASKFFPVDDADGNGQIALCETDYFRRLDLLCHSCGKALRGSYITALERKYHIEHFTCTVCSIVFGAEDSYYEHDNNVYCHYHYAKQFAVPCEGCQGPILKQFVEILQNGKNLQWHPECYMIHKYWNVKFHKGNLPVPALDPSRAVTDIERANLLKEVEVNNDLIHRTWSGLSSFEESAASCISDMLLHASSRALDQTILSGLKFLHHIDVLFTGLEAMDNLLHASSLSSSITLSYSREAKLLCKKFIAYLAIISKAQGPEKLGVTQELLSLVTGFAHYLKLLIRCGLEVAARIYQSQQSQEGFATLLDALADPRLSKDALATVAINQVDRSLGSQDSDLCGQCAEQVDTACMMLGDTGKRFHSGAGHFVCKACGRDLRSDFEVAYDAENFNLYCLAKCDNQRSFLDHRRLRTACPRKITLLQQYSFLLRVALMRAALTLKGIDL